MKVHPLGATFGLPRCTTFAAVFASANSRIAIRLDLGQAIGDGPEQPQILYHVAAYQRCIEEAGLRTINSRWVKGQRPHANCLALVLPITVILMD